MSSIKYVWICILLNPIFMTTSHAYFASSLKSPSHSKDNSLSSQTLSTHFFLEGDFLYWLAKQEGNQFAITGNAITVPGTTDPNTGGVAAPVEKGKIKALDFNMSIGYRVGGGFNLPHQFWDVGLIYTHLNSHAKGSIYSNDLNSGIIPLFSFTPYNSILSLTSYANPSAAEGFVSKAKSSWNIDFNTLTADLGRKFDCLKRLHVRPFIGLQGTWQKQDLDILYQVSSLSNSNSLIGSNTIKYRQFLWAVGGRVGIDTSWSCFTHLDIFGNLSAALLWGQFNVKALSFDTNTIEGYQDIEISNQNNLSTALTSVTNVQLGLRLKWLFHNYYQLYLQAGWENQYWFFQNQHSSSIADTSLILQGLTLKLKLEF